MSHTRRRLLLFLVTEDWYFVSHRLPLAQAAVREGFRVMVATRIGVHGDRLRDAGCEVLPLNWVRATGNPLGELRFLLGLVGHYRRLAPDVVHHVAIKPVVYGSIAAWMARVPRIVNAIAGLGYVFTTSRGLARLLRPLLRNAFRILLNRPGSWVILQNPDDRATLIREAGLKPSHAVLIRGAGVDLVEFRSRPLPEGVPIVLLPSRILWDKGIGEFVEAARSLRRRSVSVRFVLVGGLDPDNRRAVDEAKVEGWVREGIIEWWGHQSLMSNVLAQATIVTLPSFYGEGIPKALLEAAACGRPIVTTDTPGCREVVTDGDNGRLIPPRDAPALAAAVEQLLREPETLRRMGQRSRERAESEFSIEAVIRATMPLYHRSPGAA
jgi:glycosyltransferase involved in cell wall biosynthesis